jgi:AbiV family abortive infection protein
MAKDEELPVDFTKAQLREGCKRCIGNVKGLLESALLLLDNESSQQYGRGLYMYATEEFGKAILLRRYVTCNKSKYRIPSWVLGKEKPKFESIVQDRILRELLEPQIPNPDKIIAFYRNVRHVLSKEHLPNKKNTIGKVLGLGISARNAKLLIGFNNLPDVCSMLPMGIKVSTAFTYNKEISITPNKKVFLIPGISGRFFDITHINIEHVTEKFTPKLLEKVFLF